MLRHLVSTDPEDGATVWLLDDRHDGWVFSVLVSAAFVAVGFSMRPFVEDEFLAPAPGRRMVVPSDVAALSTRTLRSVRLAELQAAAVAHVRQDWEKRESGRRPPKLEKRQRDLAVWRKGFEAKRRPGRAGRGDRDYAVVAEVYVLALAGDTPVIHAVAEQLEVSPSTARNLVHEARARGLLTTPERGRAGGGLTDKARALLAED